MGSTSFYPEEAPIHTVTVAAFAVERHPVTNAQFAEFVSATGYVTVAEQPIDPALYPGADANELRAGAMVFSPTPGPVDLRDWRRWWVWVPGASWRHPFGPDSDVAAHGDHPVVQVAYPDAAAYARWIGRRLPTEAEWEYAARGGAATTYAWGDEEKPDGKLMANTWQGSFPYRNDGALGWIGTSPVGAFPPNDFGLVDMIGNGPPPAESAAEGLLRAVGARRPGYRADAQGWLAPVCARVLPSVSARGAVTAIARHGHHPHRVPMRARSALRRSADGGDGAGDP